ncbi:hypothetical protein [Patulibacter americanus]|uniref:hypothetical protein n=1 Tax=Patulibacter americanus TaxID=588672 RepID=UPI0003B6F0EB|nr:hypothetical protein [Patulibacter americanus]
MLSETELRQWATECRGRALEALAAGRPMVVYDHTQAWISAGGARTLAPWLVSAASALQLGQNKTAVHATDHALEHWIGDDGQRGVLCSVRGEVVRRHLKDPKTARVDLDVAARLVPQWLRADAERAASTCHREATASRKRKPSVGPAPGHAPIPSELPWATTVIDLDRPVSEAPPSVWSDVHRVLVADDPRVPAEQRWVR